MAAQAAPGRTGSTAICETIADDAPARGAVNQEAVRDVAAVFLCVPFRNQSENLANLKVGGTAPEISGEDIDGRPMKLADYKGKVVVLDFWGHW